ncbi:MAG: pseudaminic acid synthase [Lachnospiraceae bacterium]|nr:pseudaminic acid synthase [Lachnospiraceae bacterium]
MFSLFEKINNNEVYIIAEMSANHGGNLDNALEIVRKVAEAGADCLKIQTYTADSITLDCDSEDFQIHGGLWDGYKLYDLYTDAGTPYEWQSRIKEECDRYGIDFLSTPFDNDAVDFLEDIGCEAYKIASFELVDIPLIEYAAAKGKPMIISCGMGSREEIEEAVAACMRVGNQQIVLLKCCSEYPANWENMHLANIPDMIANYKVPVGLSDHSEGFVASTVAVSLGAHVIEKHVKLEGVSSADSEFSMLMDDFADMVNNVRIVNKMIGNVNYGPTKGESANYLFRRSLFAVKDIKKGELFSDENVRSIRPAQGLEPKYYSELIGNVSLSDIKRGEPIKPYHYRDIN